MIELKPWNKSLLLLICLFCFSPARAENDKAFVWQVVSENNTMFLLGSIHFADKSFYPLRQEIEEAFERSNYLVVELDITKIDHQTYNNFLANNGVYKGDTTIKDVISEETLQQLKLQLRQLNISYDSIKKYKPGVLVLTLTSMQVIQMGFDPELGIDAYFLAKVSQLKQSKSAPLKQIIELESLQQQLNLFINIPDGELLLKESLYSLNESDALMADMVRIWKQGDEVQMNKLLFEDALNEYPAFGEIYDDLFYRRNRQMVSKIDVMLQRKTKQREYYFVVVGSGHLIGDKGIVNVLREKGYKLKRL